MYQSISRAADIGETPLAVPGVSIRTLHTDPETGGIAVITTLSPGATIPRHWHSRADETVYVLSGDFIEDGTSYGPGTFFAGKAGTLHGPHSSISGCSVLTHFSAELDFQSEDTHEHP